MGRHSQGWRRSLIGEGSVLADLATCIDYGNVLHHVRCSAFWSSGTTKHSIFLSQLVVGS